MEKSGGSSRRDACKEVSASCIAKETRPSAVDVRICYWKRCFKRLSCFFLLFSRLCATEEVTNRSCKGCTFSAVLHHATRDKPPYLPASPFKHNFPVMKASICTEALLEELRTYGSSLKGQKHSQTKHADDSFAVGCPLTTLQGTPPRKDLAPF